MQRQHPLGLTLLILLLSAVESGGKTWQQEVITDESLKVGVVLPTKGALAETGSAIRDVLNAYFDSVNRDGVNNAHKIALRFADSTDDPAITVANVRRLIQEEEVFAIVSGISAGADEEIAVLAQAAKVPLIGPATLLPSSGPTFNRYGFYLLPGLREQAQALVLFAARRSERPNARIAIIYAEGILTSAAANAAELQTRRSGWRSIVKRAYQRQHFNAPEIVRSLKQEGVEFVLFFGAPSDDVAFVNEATIAKWAPIFLLPGVLSSRELPGSAKIDFKEKIFLTFPTVPSDVSATGREELLALRNKYKLAPRSISAQIHALAAAKVFVEGLRLSGNVRDREKLIASLESMRGYDTGLTPKITFGPKNRIGAKGSYIVSVNTETGRFTSEAEWIPVD
jgi:ABC-type branched-subunit amino acid transport system substrate-binding protein